MVGSDAILVARDGIRGPDEKDIIKTRDTDIT